MLRAIVLLTVFAFTTSASADSKSIKLLLDQQKRPNIFSVSYLDKSGKSYWYQFEWTVFENGESKTKSCDVFYDSISENFFCTRGNHINVIPMNRPFEIFSIDKQ